MGYWNQAKVLFHRRVFVLALGTIHHRKTVTFDLYMVLGIIWMHPFPLGKSILLSLDSPDPIAFCTVDETNPERAPMPKAGKTVFATNGRTHAANLAKRPRNHLLFSC